MLFNTLPFFSHVHIFVNCDTVCKIKSPTKSETHFKVIIVSPKFATVKAPIKRHRMVNDILALELSADGTVHALSIVAKSPDQWEAMVQKATKHNSSITKNKIDPYAVMIPPSPPCLGGDGTLASRKGEGD